MNSPIAPNAPPYPAPQAFLPSLASTIWITLFFGLFGLIPASMHTNRARDMGVRTSRYWKAFGFTFAGVTAAWIILAVSLVAAGSAATDTYNRNLDHVSSCINGMTIDTAAVAGPSWPAGCEDVSGP
jgi:hypothetical protein